MKCNAQTVICDSCDFSNEVQGENQHSFYSFRCVKQHVAATSSH